MSNRQNLDMMVLDPDRFKIPIDPTENYPKLGPCRYCTTITMKGSPLAYCDECRKKGEIAREKRRLKKQLVRRRAARVKAKAEKATGALAGSSQAKSAGLLP
jgi:hypothetical protein